MRRTQAVLARDDSSVHVGDLSFMDFAEPVQFFWGHFLSLHEVLDSFEGKPQVLFHGLVWDMGVAQN